MTTRRYSGLDNPGRGGLVPEAHAASPREVTMLQRSSSKAQNRLGKTTGWIHRATLQHRKIARLYEVQYVRVDDAGLHVVVQGAPRVLDVDTIVVCAGQTSVVDLVVPLRAAGVAVQVIGGADEAAELDARRAISQGAQVAAAL